MAYQLRAHLLTGAGQEGAAPIMLPRETKGMLFKKKH